MKKHFPSRNLRAIDIHKFKTNELNLPLEIFMTMDLESLLNEYDDCLRSISDNHAPAKFPETAPHPKAPWYIAESNDQKRLRRRFEKKWYKTKTHADKNLSKQRCCAVSKLIDSSKSAYCTDLIKNRSVTRTCNLRMIAQPRPRLLTL